MYNIEYLFKITNRYREEAERCYKDNCYLLSFVAYGAALEGVLLAMCFCYPEKVRKTKNYQNYRKRIKRKRGLFLKLTLNDLLKIAEELDWVPFQEKVEDAGTARDWVYWVKQTRNLVHPAKWLKKDGYFVDLHKTIKIEKGEWIKLKKLVDLSREAVEGVMMILNSKINKDLVKELKLDNKNKSYANTTRKNNK